jgi:hypothetical protein
VWQRFGARNAMLIVADDLLGRISRAHILVIRVYDTLRLESTEIEQEGRFAVRPVSPEELLARTPTELERLTLSREFIEFASRKGDVCIGVFDAVELVSFQWYANSTTEIFSGITLDAGAPYLYAYNAFTTPGHRGLRLHSLGLIYAAMKLCAPQNKRLLSYINASNISSRLSGARLPMREGAIFLWPASRGFRFLQTRFCRSLNLQLRYADAKAVDRIQE